jgi:hypothetical protein
VHLVGVSNGNVETSFTPDNAITAMHPMLAKSLDTAEWDNPNHVSSGYGSDRKDG